MNNFLKFLLCFVALTSSIVMGVWSYQEPSSNLNVNDSTQKDKEEIMQLIDSYFDIRYRSHKTLKFIDFSFLTEESKEGKDFLIKEQRKLEDELYLYDINNLRYQEYQYSFSNINFLVEPLSKKAVVSLNESHDIVFESLAPRISKMRDLHHTISLSKESGSWKIVEDKYDDYLWRFVKKTGKKDKELKNIIDKASKSLEQGQVQSSTLIINTETLNSIDTTNRSYNGLGAAEYADRYAINFNPDYYDFSGQILGGDCTNFVSQAIRHGGQAPMANNGQNGIGTAGWYYYDVNHRAAAWTDVGRLYEFLVNEHPFWQSGPEGILSSYSSVRWGDVIQFKWDSSDNIWDHSVIVADLADMGNGTYQLLVDSHSPNVSQYPLNLFSPWSDIRYIHITNIKGYFIFLPLIENFGDGQYMPSSSANLQDPYPAPMDLMDSNYSNSGEETTFPETAYPAP